MVVKVGEPQDDVPDDLQVATLLYAFLLHHEDEMAVPFFHFFFRFLRGSELCQIVLFEFIRVQVVGTENIFHLPHVKQVFGNVFFFKLLGYIHIFITINRSA